MEIVLTTPLDNVLANLTSNVLINLTADATLSLNISLLELHNVSIIGYNNPTVTCRNGGGLHLSSCHNFTIEGITWDGCGDQDINKNNDAIIWFHINSSSITIRSCSFINSVGQAVVLSNVSGTVNIDKCLFLNNSQYRGNGTAIYYKTEHPQVAFTINNCNFSNNGGDTIVHIGSCTAEVLLQNSEFHKNQGIPIYVSNKGLKVDGFLMFKDNVATNGGGIYVDHYSTLKFSKNSTVTFSNNTASDCGGAIFIQNDASALFEHSNVLFYNNKADFGGAVCSQKKSKTAF